MLVVIYVYICFLKYPYLLAKSPGSTSTETPVGAAGNVHYFAAPGRHFLRRWGPGSLKIPNDRYGLPENGVCHPMTVIQLGT